MSESTPSVLSLPSLLLWDMGDSGVLEFEFVGENIREDVECTLPIDTVILVSPVVCRESIVSDEGTARERGVCLD